MISAIFALWFFKSYQQHRSPTATFDSSDPTQVPGLVHDFGVVRPETYLAHEFRFPAPWKEKAELQEVGLSCRCIAPTIDWKTLTPNQERVVQAAFTAGTQIGSEERVVTLNFDQDRKLKLLMRARVEEVYSTPAKQVLMKYSRPEDELTQELLIHSYFINEPPKVALSPAADWLSIESLTEVPLHQVTILPAPVAAWRISLKSRQPASGDQPVAFVTVELPAAHASLKRADLRIPVIRRGQDTFALFPKLITVPANATGVYVAKIDLVASSEDSKPPINIRAFLRTGTRDIEKLDCHVSSQTDRLTKLALRIDPLVIPSEKCYIVLKRADSSEEFGRIPVGRQTRSMSIPR